VPDWPLLVPLPEAELASRDFAAVNLACAAGLPGAEGLDLERCLLAPDVLARHVERETARAAHQFRDDPAAFENSPAYFRALVLATVLQEDCGVRYEPALIDRDDFFHDAANLFLHGVLQGKGGTCSSLPPFYVAVGRRLGYPMKLALTKGHVFARWDDPAAGERFNVECTSRGLVCHPDAYYRDWPFRTTVEEEQHFGWLVSLTPREELAWFFVCRGHCWLDNGHFREASESYAFACSLVDRHRGYEGCLTAALQRWHGELTKRAAGPIPRPSDWPEQRFPGLGPDLERAVAQLTALEETLNDGKGPRAARP
jgi:hypothetical protein